MKQLDREALLGREKIVVRECPELGIALTIRRMTAKEFLEADKDDALADARMVGACVVESVARPVPVFMLDEVLNLSAADFLAIKKQVGIVNGFIREDGASAGGAGGAGAVEKKQNASTEPSASAPPSA